MTSVFAPVGARYCSHGWSEARFGRSGTRGIDVKRRLRPGGTEEA